jgi:hypothetical protein
MMTTTMTHHHQRSKTKCSTTPTNQYSQYPQERRTCLLPKVNKRVRR